MSTESDKFSIKQIEDQILLLLKERSIESSICPSDAARALSDNWRDLMPMVRECADKLVKSEQIVITQKGRKIPSAVDAKGPIRLKLSR